MKMQLTVFSVILLLGISPGLCLQCRSCGLNLNKNCSRHPENTDLLSCNVKRSQDTVIQSYAQLLRAPEFAISHPDTSKIDAIIRDNKRSRTNSFVCSKIYIGDSKKDRVVRGCLFENDDKILTNNSIIIIHTCNTDGCNSSSNMSIAVLPILLSIGLAFRVIS